MKIPHITTGADGYTLIEIVVVMAIIGLFTITLVNSGSGNVAVERFSGSVAEFANYITEAEVNAYSSQVGDCPEGSECFWRGNVIEYSVANDTAHQYLLVGEDISAFSTSNDQQRGIFGKQLRQQYSLRAAGLDLTGIGISCNLGALTPNPNTMCADAHSELSLALLSPDGRAFTASRHYSNGGSSNPDSFDPASRPYDGDSPVTFILEDEAVAVTGYVTFDPRSGNITTRVQ